MSGAGAAVAQLLHKSCTCNPPAPGVLAAVLDLTEERLVGYRALYKLIPSLCLKYTALSGCPALKPCFMSTNLRLS